LVTTALKLLKKVRSEEDSASEYFSPLPLVYPPLVKGVYELGTCFIGVARFSNMFNPASNSLFESSTSSTSGSGNSSASSLSSSGSSSVPFLFGWPGVSLAVGALIAIPGVYYPTRFFSVGRNNIMSRLWSTSSAAPGSVLWPTSRKTSSSVVIEIPYWTTSRSSRCLSKDAKNSVNFSK